MQNAVRNVVNESAVSLVGVDWMPLDRTALLRFRTHEGGVLLIRLGGIHLFATRQSVQDYSQLSDESWEDWFLHYFEVLADSEFLDRLLTQRLGLTSHIFPYSLNGADPLSRDYVRPLHLALVTGGGHIDVVCETIQLVDH